MIEYIRGKVAEATPTYAVIECNGIGYVANISLNTYEAINGKTEAQLYIHEAIREDAYTLYGFASSDERTMFRLLTSVSGVGASTARVIVSALSTNELQSAIASDDVNTMKRIKGIGLKTAQRIIVELKDKVEKLGVAGGGLPNQANAGTQHVRDEAISALEILGFNKAASTKVVEQILRNAPDSKVEAVVKEAFKSL